MPNVLKLTKKTKKEKGITWYIKQLDKEFSLLVREKGICEASDVSTCGGGLQDAHIVGRANHTLRWDIVNHLSLCYRHHIFFAHHDPVEFLLWFQKKYPARWNYILQARKLFVKRTLDDYKQLLEDVKAHNLQKLHVML
jgi:hypothetical protein